MISWNRQGVWTLGLCVILSGACLPCAAQVGEPGIKKRAELRLQAQAGHALSVTAVGFVPGGRRVLTASQDQSVRVWHVETGRELGVLAVPGDGNIEAIECSPDGSRAITLGEAAHLWDLATYRLIRAFERPAEFTQGGRAVLERLENGTTRQWDARTGSALADPVEGGAGRPRQPLSCVRPLMTVMMLELPMAEGLRRFTAWGAAYSPDGRRVLVGDGGVVKLFNRDTGRFVFEIGSEDDMPAGGAFSPDGNRFMTVTQSGVASVWTGGGVLIRTFGGPPKGNDMIYARGPSSLAFSPDGTSVMIGFEDGVTRLWDVASGQLVALFAGDLASVRSVAFSPEGRRLLTGSDDRVARLWALDQGRSDRPFEGLGRDMRPRPIGWPVAFSPDGRVVVAAQSSNAVGAWDAVSGRILRKFEAPGLSLLLGHDMPAPAFALSPDGRRLLTEVDTRVQLWDFETGREIRGFEQFKEGSPLAFTPDGAKFVTGGDTLRFWDLGTSQPVGQFRSRVESVAFSPKGTWIATSSWRDGVRILDAASGALVRSFEGAEGGVFFSPDGRLLATASSDVRLWDAATGRLHRTLGIPGARIWSVAFSPDGRWVVTASEDKTARIWDVESGVELCALVSFTDGSWAVVDPEGRYDASNGGDITGLHWVLGDEPIVLSQFKDLFYDPGLLAKRLGFTPEKPRAVPSLEGLRMHPAVESVVNGDQATVRLSERDGGGIGRYQVFLNGALVHEGQAPPGAREHTFTLGLAPFSRRLVPEADLAQGRKNVLEVVAFNAANSLASRPRGVGVVAPAARAEPPKVFVLAVGVSDYEGDRLDLRFAAKDALEFGAAMKFAAGKLVGQDRVKVRILASAKVPSGHPEASRANVVKALEEIAREASSGDVVIVFLSGHGVGRAGGEDDYHYLTKESGLADLDRPETVSQMTVSGRELASLLGAIPANKLALILDTCASGAVADDVSKGRSVSSDLKRSWERLKDRAGVFVLAGCAADAVSFEATNLGQGLLTYSLLEPLSKVDPEVLAGGADGAFLVDLSRWFGNAERRVESLARELGLGGVQRPELKAKAKARSFDVGRLEASDGGRIDLAQPKPVLLLRDFDNDDREDPIHLTQALDVALRSEGAKGDRVAYWSAVREHPNALALSGSYTVAEGVVTVDVRIQQFVREGEVLQRRTRDRITVVVRSTNPGEIAAKILDEVRLKLG